MIKKPLILLSLLFFTLTAFGCQTASTPPSSTTDSSPTPTVSEAQSLMADAIPYDYQTPMNTFITDNLGQTVTLLGTAAEVTPLGTYTSLKLIPQNTPDQWVYLTIENRILNNLTLEDGADYLIYGTASGMLSLEGKEGPTIACKLIEAY